MNYGSYTDRAMAAYFRAPIDGETRPQPSTPDTTTVNGRDYVILHNPNGILAVYRILYVRDMLKRLKRWPSQITEEFEGGAR